MLDETPTEECLSLHEGVGEWRIRVVRVGTSVVLGAAVVIGALSNGCSKNATTPNLCPTSGTYSMTVSIGGSSVMGTGTDIPLIDSANGSCGLAEPSTSCTPMELTVTVTLGGTTSTDDTTSQLNAIRWTASTGESGTCTDAVDATTGGYISVRDAAPFEETQCALSATTCSGGSIDSLGMTFDLSGAYGHAIAAGISQDGCCWRGTAEKQ